MDEDVLDGQVSLDESEGRHWSYAVHCGGVVTSAEDAQVNELRVGHIESLEHDVIVDFCHGVLLVVEASEH